MNIVYDKTFTRYCNHMDCKNCKYKEYINNCDDMDCEAMWQLEHDEQIRADIIEEVDLHLREADYEYDSNMGIGDNIGSALLKEYANGYKKGEQDGRVEERKKVLDEVKKTVERMYPSLAIDLMKALKKL